MATTDNTSPTTPAKKAPARKKVAPKASSASSSALTESGPENGANTGGKPAALREEASKVVSKLKTSAKDAASSGKEKTTSALDDVSAMVEDVARTIDARVGPKYGAYARKAADALTGMSESLKSKDVDQLLGDARDFVRRKPAIAIGAAAALGFVLTRLIKADDTDNA